MSIVNFYFFIVNLIYYIFILNSIFIGFFTFLGVETRDKNFIDRNLLYIIIIENKNYGGFRICHY